METKKVDEKKVVLYYCAPCAEDSKRSAWKTEADTVRFEHRGSVEHLCMIHRKPCEVRVRPPMAMRN